TYQKWTGKVPRCAIVATPHGSQASLVRCQQQLLTHTNHQNSVNWFWQLFAAIFNQLQSRSVLLLPSVHSPQPWHDRRPVAARKLAFVAIFAQFELKMFSIMTKVGHAHSQSTPAAVTVTESLSVAQACRTWIGRQTPSKHRVHRSILVVDQQQIN